MFGHTNGFFCRPTIRFVARRFVFRIIQFKPNMGWMDFDKFGKKYGFVNGGLLGVGPFRRFKLDVFHNADTLPHDDIVTDPLVLRGAKVGTPRAAQVTEEATREQQAQQLNASRGNKVRNNKDEL